MFPTLRQRNNVLSLDHSPLVQNNLAETYLTADASGSTLTVKNITGFAISQVLLLEELGNENAEIILTHASTSPSGTTITLVSSLTRTHLTGCKVKVLPYNQFELSHATTATGSKTLLTVSGGEPPSSLGSGLIAIDPSRLIQSYQDSQYSSGFYFARYYHSVDATNSSYSDAIEYGGWDENTVGYMIDQALEDLGLTLSDKINRHSCYRWINEGLALIQGKIKRWPEHYTYDSIVGQTTRGTNTLSMPSTIYDSETNRSLIALRLEGNPLTYVDPPTFGHLMQFSVHTQVTTQATSGSTTLEIDDSYGFADSGDVDVYISGGKYTISYTSVTRSSTAGILNGIPASGDGAITITIPVDSNVWQNEPEGTPAAFTVRNGQMEFVPLPDGNQVNKNFRADFSHIATRINSDGDEIDYQRYDMVLPYLTWKIKMKSRNDSNLDKEDGYYTDFKEKMNDAIRTLPPNIVYKHKPMINRMNRAIYPSSFKALTFGTDTVTGSSATFYTETPSGAIDSSNKIYTVINPISQVIVFYIGSTPIHPSEYSTSSSTITFVTALDISLAAEAFTIVYTST